MPNLHRSEHRIPFIVWVALPLIFAAVLRLYRIAELEPFVDEGANILTALDPRVRQAFEPLEQGRPLLVWLFLPSGWLPASALEIARCMTAFAGIVTAAAIGWALHILSGRGAALVGMWTWAVLPIAVWHERLALQDPFVTAALASAIAMVTAANRHNARNRSAWLAGAGFWFGVSFLLKISALLTLPWLGWLYCGIQSHFSRPVFERRVAWFIVGAMAPVTTLGQSLLRLGSGLGRYEALPKLESGNVARAAVDRLETWVGWYTGYGGWALLLLMAVALLIAITLRLRLPLVCAASWALSLVISSFFLNNGYARYTLPDHLPLVFFLGLSLGSARLLTWRALATAAVAIAMGGWAWIALHIGINPAHAAVPRADIEQYVTGAWSGRGVNEVHRFLMEYADRNSTACVVLVHRFLRPGCYGMLLAQLGDPRVGVVPFTVYTREDLSTAVGLLQRQLQPDSRLAIFLLYEGSLYPAQPWLDHPGAPTSLVLTTDRGNGERFSLYRVDEIPAPSAPPAPL